MAPLINTHEHNRALFARGDGGDAGWKFGMALIIICLTVVGIGLLFCLSWFIIIPLVNWYMKRGQEQQYDGTFDNHPDGVGLDTMDTRVKTPRDARANAAPPSEEQSISLSAKRRHQQQEYQRQEFQRREFLRREHQYQEIQRKADQHRKKQQQQQQQQQQQRRTLQPPKPPASLAFRPRFPGWQDNANPGPSRQQQSSVVVVSPSSSSRAGTTRPSASDDTLAELYEAYTNFAEHGAQPPPQVPRKAKTRVVVGGSSFD